LPGGKAWDSVCALAGPPAPMDMISAVIITKDEGRNIERCLESLAPVVDEIVVVDDFSTDDTVALCERHGARVVRERWRGFGAQKNLANGLAAHEYVLSIDADEALDPELQEAIRAAKAQGLRGAYAVSRLNSYYGRFIRHGFEYPDRKIRLFPRSGATWDEQPVHEQLRVDGARPGARLGGHLLHYTYLRVEEHVLKANRYTNLAAEGALARGGRPSLAKMVLGPVATFLRAYVLKRGFLDGLHGFVLAALHAHATFLKHVKLWDLHRERRLP
jgi:glycosyltransferase involved in cell wall biosynthesis